MRWVVDASAVVELTLRTAVGERVRAMTAGQALFAPDILDAECMSALRRLVHRGDLDQVRAGSCLELITRLPARRLSSRDLWRGAWALRDRLTAYDAMYVAAAERLDAAVLTADGALSRAPGLPVVVINVRGTATVE